MSCCCSAPVLLGDIFQEQTATGAAAGEQVAYRIQRRSWPRCQNTNRGRRRGRGGPIRCCAHEQQLGSAAVAIVQGRPSDLRAELTKLAGRGEHLTLSPRVAAPPRGHCYKIWARNSRSSPKCSSFRRGEFSWPTFLMPDNLLGVANQVAVSAIVAIGMTMVIITGGIDLSVGSLLAPRQFARHW